MAPKSIPYSNILWLQTPPDGKRPDPPVTTRKQCLPFSELKWEDFERLCLRLAACNGEVEHCQLYGKRGQSQGGIDLYVRLRSGGRYETWQSKRRKIFTRSDLKSSVDKFLDGEWVEKTDTFYLCVTVGLEDTKLLEEIEIQATRLKEKGIFFATLDASTLSLKLKNYPNLIDEFFGREWVKQFCGYDSTQLVLRQISLFDETQEDKINRLQRIYIERRTLAKAVDQFLSGTYCYCLIVGVPGCGKSAFTASLIRRRQGQNDLVAFHLIERNRHDWKHIIVSILYQIRLKLGVGPTDSILSGALAGELKYDELESLYLQTLSQINQHLRKSNKILLVVIDALDELVDSGHELSDTCRFQFIPRQPDFDKIRFVITSRTGKILQSFYDYLGANRPETLILKPLHIDHLKRLASLCSVSLSQQERKKILEKTDGNPLYIRAILERLADGGRLDLTRLPKSVLHFYQGDLRERFKTDHDNLLRETLALMYTSKEPLSASDLAEIIGIKIREVRNKALTQLGCYFNVAKQKGVLVYSFYHQSFSQALIEGNNPILENDEIQEALEKIIAWCEPFENLSDFERRFQYGRNYLPVHYWERGKTDRYAGFLSLLGRNDLNCEIACRYFLKELIIAKPQKVQLEDRSLMEVVVDIFLKGNEAARFALFRFNSDLSGYGYGEWKKHLWDKIVRHFREGDWWLDRTIISSSAGSLRKERLDIAERRIPVYQNPQNFDEKRFLLRYSEIAGIILCKVRERFDPDHGLKLLRQAMEIHDTIVPDDYLPMACNDPQFARYLYVVRKASLYNNYAISLRRTGFLNEAVEYYNKALTYHEKNDSHEFPDHLRFRIRNSITLNGHNVGHIHVLLGRFDEAFDLLLETLEFRAAIGQQIGFNSTLLQLIFLFEDLELHQLSAFFRTLLYSIRQPITPDGKTTREFTQFIFFLRSGQIKQAKELLVRLEELRGEKKQTPIIRFRIVRDRFRIAVAEKKEKSAITLFKECLNILKKNDEWHIMTVPDREYFNFWETAVKARLLHQDINGAEDLIKTKLVPWFERFQLVSLRPRFLRLEAIISEYQGDTAKAAHLRAEGEKLLEEGRKQLVGRYFSGELMRHLDYLVNNCRDEKLTHLYGIVRDRLTSGTNLGIGEGGGPCEPVVRQTD